MTVPLALSVPPPLVVSTDHSLASAVAWTSNGADELFIELYGATSFRCRVANDGSFDVPAEVATALPGSSDGLIVARNLRTVDVQGREVTLVGAYAVEVGFSN